MTPTAHFNMKSIPTDQLVHHSGSVGSDCVRLRQMISGCMKQSEETVLLWWLTSKIRKCANNVVVLLSVSFIAQSLHITGFRLPPFAICDFFFLIIWIYLSQTTESTQKMKCNKGLNRSLDLLALEDFQSEQNLLNSAAHSSFRGQPEYLLCFRCRFSSSDAK